MSVPFSTIWTQYFPPKGPLTEANLPSQTGKVFIVTGGSNGLGYELSRQLYGAGGKVYILTRSKDRTETAMAKIRAHYQEEDAGKKQRGSLEFVQMDLMDFASVRTAAREFLAREGPNGRLDVLQRTSKIADPGAVRVTWPGSLMVETSSPKDGVRKEFLNDPAAAPKEFKMNQNELYASTKAACYFLATEFSRREPREGGGVIHLAGNPGNYATNLWAHVPTLLYALVRPALRNPSPHGADTWLWMGLSDEVTLEDAAAGRYAMCDGRWHPGQRGDLVAALRDVSEGGSGRAKEVFEWCEKEVAEFLK
ncbi:hypothetical protein N0V82_009009 [Gnomoniopsis sp. IMI 355080]|nr:hypothetical protein N0V82_009009 [Gnomoniopsis sp. IMI 355080]